MTGHDPNGHGTLRRVPTGVPGLDTVIGGGLLEAGVYILQGSPGAGKTILANQICYHHIAAGGRVVYLTLLAESHARMLQHLRTLSYFDERAVPDAIYYASAFDALRTDGLPGVVALLRNEMRNQKAGIVVLDGLVMAANAAGSDEALKLFISEVQAHSALTGCTTLLLASHEPDRPVTPEQTMVDGIVLLRESARGPRRERNLEVVKFRGGATLRGTHAFRIGADGIRVFPRVESALQASPGRAVGRRGAPSGVDGLDRMFDLGGLPDRSVVTVAGYAGSGKTTLALHFLARATPEAPALFFGFYESPETLVDIGRTFGLDLAALQASGALEFAWQHYGEHILDELGYRLLDAVRRSGAKRVVVDGVGGFAATPSFADRGDAYFACLGNELRRMGATTLLTVESGDPLGRTLAVSSSGLSASSDGLLRLRITEEGDAVRRDLAIIKMRNCTYDQRVRGLFLTQTGLRLDLRGPDAGPAGA
ncbi:MAG TPA: ATPase domain-containing protein [Burkholderiaceae bacterium]|nr:ATPase domain-containing protein [Burkholderiaceae bacterium]